MPRARALPVLSDILTIEKLVRRPSYSASVLCSSAKRSKTAFGKYTQIYVDKQEIEEEGHGMLSLGSQFQEVTSASCWLVPCMVIVRARYSQV